MKPRPERQWIVFCLLLGLAVTMLIGNAALPASPRGHQVILALALILFIIAGASFIYTYALRHSNSDDAWWNDDDWSHWGGI